MAMICHHHIPMTPSSPKTRFAPSPSGLLHLGHVLAALEARHLADKLGGECLLRMEDIDTVRCKPIWMEKIQEDLSWLGIHFDGDVLVQSQRMSVYEQALERLKELGVVYPCFCTRRQIAEEIERIGRAPQGERVDPYPGTCRELPEEYRQEMIQAGRPHAWRLDCRKAKELTGVLEWEDLRFGRQVCDPSTLGDVTLGRKDCLTSYHLSVVIDDAFQQVTHVTRGEDLFESTGIHRTLQALLGLPVPVWYHHRLVCDDHGVRLAKRNNSLAVRTLREEGVSASQVIAMATAGEWH
jgi:glutamyl-Q tRNA(Asp) synthetase